MHQLVKDGLEEYLRGVSGRFEKPFPRDVQDHLGTCQECTGELQVLERQALALRSLRAPADVEPRPGLYARVILRIDEARATSSVWAAFLDPIFARRLAFGSVALGLLLGAYLISTEPGSVGQPRTPNQVVASQNTLAAADEADSPTPQERDAVLVKLVASE